MRSTEDSNTDFPSSDIKYKSLALPRSFIIKLEYLEEPLTASSKGIDKDLFLFANLNKNKSLFCLKNNERLIYLCISIANIYFNSHSIFFIFRKT